MGIHAYYPQRRTPYGPRMGLAHCYVDERQWLPADELARDYPYLDIERRAMPKGGSRVYVHCQTCGRSCEKLFAGFCGLWECRQCADLVYWTQYDGRHIEASQERIFRYLRSGGGAARTKEAHDIWLERELQHDARAWASIAISNYRWGRYLAKVNAWERGEVTPEETSADKAKIIQLQSHWRALSQHRARRKAA
jgi:hypothetical protein